MHARAAAAAWILGIVLAHAPRAHADPRVVIVETTSGPVLPALATQVAVHADGATIVTVQVADTAGLAARAASLVEEHDATLVVWVETTPAMDAHQTFIVYVAGAWPNRALMELVRVPASTPANELERTVALKIAALLDTVLAPRPTGTVLGVADAAAPPGRWWLGLGADLALGGGDRDLGAGPLLMIQRDWPVHRWLFRADASLRWLRHGVIADSVARVGINEVGAMGGGTVGRTIGGWAAVASVELGFAAISADATAQDGRTGSARVTIPSVGAGVGVRAPVVVASLELGVKVERSLIRQRFLVDGFAAADLGRNRVVVGVWVAIPVF